MSRLRAKCPECKTYTAVAIGHLSSTVQVMPTAPGAAYRGAAAAAAGETARSARARSATRMKRH